MNLKLKNIAAELDSFLAGRLRVGQLRRRLDRLSERLEDAAASDASRNSTDGLDLGGEPAHHRHEASREEQAVCRTRAAALTTLELLDLVLTPAFPRLSEQSLKTICRLVEERLRREDVAVARRCVPQILRELGHLRLFAVGNPLTTREPPYGTEPPYETESPYEKGPDYDEHWIDVGLLRSLQAAPNGQDIYLEETVALIPFSVFTAEFFYGDLPDVLDEELGRDRGEAALGARGETASGGVPPLWRDDEFYYHPENDLAIPLHERYPQLKAQAPAFQYFVGTTGLAEIVLDVPRIGRRALRLAAQLFCLRNGVRRATLDGRLVAGAPRSPPL